MKEVSGKVIGMDKPTQWRWQLADGENEARVGVFVILVRVRQTSDCIRKFNRMVKTFQFYAKEVHEGTYEVASPVRETEDEAKTLLGQFWDSIEGSTFPETFPPGHPGNNIPKKMRKQVPMGECSLVLNSAVPYQAMGTGGGDGWKAKPHPVPKDDKGMDRHYQSTGNAYIGRKFGVGEEHALATDRGDDDVVE